MLRWQCNKLNTLNFILLTSKCDEAPNYKTDPKSKLSLTWILGTGFQRVNVPTFPSGALYMKPRNSKRIFLVAVSKSTNKCQL